jgi:hypothetical protein
MPLGASAGASVYLVQSDEPCGRLLRLKIYATAAPATFLSAFGWLKQQLDDLRTGCVVSPLAACVDRKGRPWVLSPFRPGVPVLARRAATGANARGDEMHLVRLRAALCHAHARGLVHGSIVPGNVMVTPDRTEAYLLDFGLRGLLSRPADAAPAACDDLAGCALLAKRLQETSAGMGRDRL